MNDLLKSKNLEVINLPIKIQIKKYLIIVLAIVTIIVLQALSGQLIQADSNQNETPFNNSKFVEIDNINLHYRIDKAITDQPLGKILMVHGMGGSTYCWRENTGPLSESGFTVITVDLPAFGFSDRQPGLDHTAKNRADWLWGLLDFLDSELFNDNTPWILVGHSMGAKPIAEMAFNRNQDVEALIFVSGAVFNSPPNLIGNLSDRTPFNHIFEFVIQNILHQPFAINRALKSAYGREVSEEQLSQYLEPLKLEGTARAWLDLVRSSSDELQNLEQLEIKSLLIWGSEDSWVPVDDAIKLNNKLPESYLEIISDNHHMPMVTASEEVNNLIIDFLNNIVR